MLKKEEKRRLSLEVNWGWDATHGSIPFKRPLLTARNIRDQRRIARAGTLIHWAGKPCIRGQKKLDERTETLSTISGSISCITHSALASNIGNVNCLQCRKNYFK